MKLQNNPFNWGVHHGTTFRSFQDSIETVAKGLKEGYIDQGLTDPRSIAAKYAPSSDGNDEEAWATTVSSVMSKLGSQRRLPPPPPTAAPVRGSLNIPSGGLRPAQDAMMQSVGARKFDPQTFGRNLAQSITTGGGRTDLTQMPTLIQQSFVDVPPPPSPLPVPGSGVSPSLRSQVDARVAGQVADEVGTPRPSGKTLQVPLNWKGTHVTDGLDWNHGKKTAADIMAAPGTQVLAPTDGVVLKLGSAQGGEALYFRGSDGSTWWLGHVDNILKPGAKVRRGEPLALISSDHAAPHLHLDRLDG